MKKIVTAVLSAYGAALMLGFVSCASTQKLEEGEELVKYIDIKSMDGRKFKTLLTDKELREDCDYLKYYMYNCYAGIEEAIQNGFDLDAAVEGIYSTMLTKKQPDTEMYSSSDLRSEIHTTFGTKLKNRDMHLSMGGNLRDQNRIRYTSVYFEKIENGASGDGVQFRVKKSEEEKITPGQLFTGVEANLYETCCDGEILYRYGVLTSKNVKSANIGIEGENLLIPVKVEKEIPQKEAWNNQLNSGKTLYLSLSDCVNLNLFSSENTFSMEVYEKSLKKIPEAIEGKENLIIDLRSNSGGRYEIPVKMLASAFYYKHNDDEVFRKNLEACLNNSIHSEYDMLVSPLTMQNFHEAYAEDWKGQYELFSEESHDFLENYVKNVKRRPVRKMTKAFYDKTDFTEIPEPDFKGKVYVLINCYTASASEMALGVLYNIAQKGIDVTLVGENSCGAILYVGVCSWPLPNSGIYLSLGDETGSEDIYKNMAPFKGEGKGFYPDYWATNETILDTLIYLTGDQELKDVLAGLDKSLL